MNKKILITLFAIVIVLGVIGIFIIKGNTSGDVVKEISTNNSNEKVFALNATRFQYNPDTITVNQGDKVKIIINNIDTNHGINLPDFNVSGKDYIEFVANKKGEFTFHCTIPCGPGHKEMQGTLIVK